jgi:streptomycin 6-kinase
MNDKNMLADLHQPEPTLAQRLQFQLQFMGIMAMAGRDKESDNAYLKAQQLAQQLIDAGH